MPKHIDISGALQFGWAKLKENWLFFLVAMAILYLLSALSSYVDRSYAHIEPTRSLLNLLFSLATVFIYFNIVRALVALVDGHKPEIPALFQYDKSVWYYLVGAILYGLIVAVGILFFIVPGIYFMVRFGLYLYAIADRQMGPIEAMKESSRLTYGVRWQLLLFYIVCIGLIIAGFFALIVGILVAAPVIAVASAYIYRELTNETKEPVEVTVENPSAATSASAPVQNEVASTGSDLGDRVVSESAPREGENGDAKE